ncbi:MAG TPA: hypothetical protein VGF55_04610 [Gemmataceae bacterium]|jgi:hypothetical protein
MTPAQADWWRWPTWREFALGAALFVGMAVLSAVLTGWVLVRLPADYFVGPTAPAFWRDRHPALRLAGRVLRNLIGAALVVLGVLLSLPGVPGQGVLTILIGLLCLDLPGKRRLEQKLIGRPRVRAAIDALRARYGRPPLRIEE